MGRQYTNHELDQSMHNHTAVLDLLYPAGLNPIDFVEHTNCLIQTRQMRPVFRGLTAGKKRMQRIYINPYDNSEIPQISCVSFAILNCLYITKSFEYFLSDPQRITQLSIGKCNPDIREILFNPHMVVNIFLDSGEIAHLDLVASRFNNGGNARIISGLSANAINQEWISVDTRTDVINQLQRTLFTYSI